MSGKRTVEDFFRVEASSSDVTQERERNISGSSGSVDIPTISRSSSLMSLGSEPEDSRPGTQASDQVDVVIAGGCSISSQELQTIKDKMAALTNYYKLSHVIKSKNAPDTSSKVLGKTIKVYNLKAKCQKVLRGGVFLEQHHWQPGLALQDQGSMAQESSPGVNAKGKGHLYSLKSDLTLDTCVDKITLSNGLAWSNDRKTFYYIDSMAYCVDAFAYDDATGNIGHSRQPHHTTGTKKVEIASTKHHVGLFRRTNFWTIPVRDLRLAGLTSEQKQGQPAGVTLLLQALGVRGVPL
ncbi:Regucalcin [Chionoecetes opilio]|uniref:Regucalcin n=1 Tax=Chionoecetes opilio TaxID=41210 RepID=A0A8J4XSN2_CHIOP|nr:Regucalcin [Chionoecetes opilio]